MPYVNIRVAGKLTVKQKEEIAAGVTKLLSDIANKPPDATYIAFDELEHENWAVGGKLLKP
ncbi:MAG: 4-oxalocrotonate tautomerase family protein [Nitrospirae bacterium]|nr:4-oxalocrotonate tautomerase family protein [Nitrospirota bacterium]